ncbi:hypothetical protein [Ensifer sp. SSB1]|jgi:hypothetical protein|uniref:hypothetical protein n=1 Tax=Ensifer sp. SSB1 TaxID=2795385 RepID=UPI001A3C7D16|nr:hypothetical protein [Ensifer sp. SSB1]MBK5566896.1 hypothetical protein [Ensifer sp. SSB1]
MKLVQFTYASNNNLPVYINPEQVVAVKATTNSTLIHVAVAADGGGVAYFPVRETLAEVVGLLQQD